MEAKWQSCINPWGVPSTLPPQTPMQETKNKLITYIQTLERPPTTPEEFELFQDLLSERERNPEEVEQRGRVRRMFRNWLYKPAPELAYVLSAQLTPRNIVDLYSDTAVCIQIEDNKESQKWVSNETVFLGLARESCQCCRER
jgi:hypothetical protein